MCLITVAIDARLRSGQVDGVARFAKGLAVALSRVPIDRIRIVWIVGSDHSWLEDSLRDGDAVVVNPAILAGSDGLWVSAGNEPAAKLALLRGVQNRSDDPRLPRSPVELAEFNVDVIHFLSQDAFVTDIPSIYHPHDMQHAAFPQFFDTATIGWRELAWRTYAGQAAVVCVAAPHVRDEVAKHWPETTGSIRVVSLESMALDVSSKSMSARSELPFLDADLDAPFVLYPAGLWPHKNHVRLIEAFIRAVGLGGEARLLLTGFELDPAGIITATIELLGAKDVVCCLGRVSEATLAHLYAKAVAVVLPSVYEAGSFPLLEAKRSGIRVAASDISAHRARGHAVDAWFDPFDVDDMASAITCIFADADTIGASQRLVASGPSGAEEFVELYEWVSGC